VDGKSVVLEESGATLPNRFRSSLRTIYACGDYEKIMEGVFENYLTVKFKDSCLENVSCPPTHGNGTVTYKPRRMPRHQRAQAHSSTLYRCQHSFM
jgi:hypothetical protein